MHYYLIMSYSLLVSVEGLAGWIVVLFGNSLVVDLASEWFGCRASVFSFNTDEPSTLLEFIVLISLDVFVLSSNTFSASVLEIPVRSQINVSYSGGTFHETTIKLEAEK